jgi:hypothetical protein
VCVTTLLYSRFQVFSTSSSSLQSQELTTLKYLRDNILKGDIAIPVEKNTFYITDIIPVADGLSSFVIIEYPTGRKVMLAYMNYEGTPLFLSYHIIVYKEQIKFIHDKVETEYDYHDKSINNYDYSRWSCYDSNAMTIIIRIINESVIEKIITITDREQRILEITLESMEEYEYKINDAYFLYFGFGLNIRDYNKPYDEKDNINRPYYYLGEGPETEVVLNDSGRGIKYRRVRSDGSKYEYWNEP